MNANEFKSACKNVTLSLKEQGIILPHAKILDIVAKSHGFKDYQTYVGMQNDYERIKSFKESKLIIKYDGDRNTGKAIYDMIMFWFNDYYSKAAPCFKNEKKHSEFPVPSIEYRNGEMILTWLSGSDGFGSNTGIIFTLALNASNMVKSNKDLYFKMKDIRLVETRVENSSVNTILTNEELLFPNKRR